MPMIGYGVNNTEVTETGEKPRRILFRVLFGDTLYGCIHSWTTESDIDRVNRAWEMVRSYSARARLIDGRPAAEYMNGQIRFLRGMIVDSLANVSFPLETQ